MSTRGKPDSGCFSAIWRRLLCQGSLQTYPSDQIPEAKEPGFHYERETGTEARIQSLVTPGVVARLMGLDSLPKTDLFDPKGKGKGKTTPDLVTRSRSVNFMDYFLEFDGVKSHHRRVRTSVSFREVPAVLDRRNDDFVVTYSDEGDDQKKKKKEEESNARERSVTKITNKKKENQGKGQQDSKFRDEPRRVSSARKNSKRKSCGNRRESGVALKKKSAAKPMHYQREILPKQKVNKKIKNQNPIKEVEKSESVAENLSPVSVLDINQLSLYNFAPSPEYERYMELNSNSNSNPKKKSLLKSIDYYGYPSSLPAHDDDDDDLELMKKKDDDVSVDKNQSTECNYTELVAKICRFTEEAMTQSKWIPKRDLVFEDFEEMCVEFGQHILNHLLQQVVDELGGLNQVENTW